MGGRLRRLRLCLLFFSPLFFFNYLISLCFTSKFIAMKNYRYYFSEIRVMVISFRYSLIFIFLAWLQRKGKVVILLSNPIEETIDLMVNNKMPNFTCASIIKSLYLFSNSKY